MVFSFKTILISQLSNNHYSMVSSKHTTEMLPSPSSFANYNSHIGENRWECCMLTKFLWLKWGNTSVKLKTAVTELEWCYKPLTLFNVTMSSEECINIQAVWFTSHAQRALYMAEGNLLSTVCLSKPKCSIWSTAQFNQLLHSWLKTKKWNVLSVHKLTFSLPSLTRIFEVIQTLSRTALSWIWWDYT